MELLTIRAFGGEMKAKFAQSEEPERMDRDRWKQTAKDLPIAILGAGLGYGVGKTVGQHLKQNPSRLTKALPAALAIGGAAATFGTQKLRRHMRERRDEASRRGQAKRAGVEPAPQSRRIPRKKPTDPWRYDPRPAGIFGP